nr:cyclin-dependent protein kinase inhibitor SMR11 [Ipomoea batatas]
MVLFCNTREFEGHFPPPFSHFPPNLSGRTSSSPATVLRSERASQSRRFLIALDYINGESYLLLRIVAMDAEANGNVSSMGEKLENLNLGNRVTMDEAAGEMVQLAKKPADSIVPPTPDLKQETGEYAVDFISPISCLPKAICFSSQDGIISSNGDDSPRTPKESVFDPFAPGPEELLLAPLCLKKSTGVARMLNFEECGRVLNFDACSEKDSTVNAMTNDEQLLGNLSRMLLQIVVSNHTEEFLAGIPNQVSDGGRTPTSAPLLTGIAETCPAAPKKTERKFISIDKDLCKKLDF